MKLFYKEPEIAIYMSKNFGVKYKGMAHPIDIGDVADDFYFSPRCGDSLMRREDKDFVFNIEESSYHISEPKYGDKDENGYEIVMSAAFSSDCDRHIEYDNVPADFRTAKATTNNSLCQRLNNEIVL